MIGNHIKIAYRSLLKNRIYSLINIIGLAVGITAVWFIALWVQNHIRYDNFYTNNENIYKVWNRTTVDGDVSVHDISSAPIAATLKREYPQVDHAARMYWSGDRLFTYGEKVLKTKGNEVDAAFLEIFDFPMTHGSAQTALTDVNSIVLTESLSKRLFGEENPLNKVLTIDNGDPYKVTGVLKDLPSHTDFDFTYLIPLTPASEKTYGINWNTNTYYTYIQLQAGSDAETFNKKIEPLVRDNAPDLKWSSVFLYPVSKMHLYSRFENGIPAGGFIEQVRLVALIGLLILSIACINFMNLATARSQKRSKEVGVRKVIGATRKSLIQQFLLESTLLAFISGLLAIALAAILLPVFNSILLKPITMDWFNPIIWGVGLIFILLTGLLAGIYPAFVLSAFKPIKSLKGTLKQKHSVSLREALVVLQFSIAVILITATLVVRLQINYAGEREIGYNASHLIEIPSEGEMDKNYETLKSELLQSGAATSVTRTGWSITFDAASAGGNLSWEGATPEQVLNSSFVIARTESDFIETLGLTLKEGRDLDYARLPADSSSVLLNETAVKAMGLTNPIGKYLKWGDATYTIVGVVKDFITGSPYREIQPMLVCASKRYLMNMVVRSNPAIPMDRNLQSIETAVKKFNPSYPFTYSFVDQQYAKKFSEQEQIATLALVFSILAIFISCLGLFGLASYIAETRVREIGIRKVLGASVTGISAMLSKDFIKLVAVSLILATPIAWWSLNHWLDDFSYRIEVEWWMLALSGTITIAIALITVSTEAIRSAQRKPVDSLKTD